MSYQALMIHSACDHELAIGGREANNVFYTNPSAMTLLEGDRPACWSERRQLGVPVETGVYVYPD
jgi:hypothetical protein